MEELKLPNEVIDSDWKDDFVDYETYGDEQSERAYIGPNEISKQSIEMIKARNLKRGQNINNIFKKNEKMAA